MKDDLIKRSDAIKAIEELPNAYNGWSDAYDKAYIIGTLEEVPSADSPQKVVAQVTFDEEKLREIVKEAVERFKEEYEIADRPQGEWTEREVFRSDDNNTSNPIIDDWQSAKCSVCGKYHTTPYLYYFDDFNYCPHCGAQMKGADDE